MDTINTADYPQLRFLCWNTRNPRELTPEEAFGVYELNWRHVEQENLTPREDALIEELTQKFGKGVLLG